MLDELLEYREYTWDLKGHDYRAERIKYGTLTRGGSDFAGLERILTIIARFYLYYYNETTAKEDRDAAFAAMLAWLGYKIEEYDNKLDDNRKQKIHDIQCWFPRYINNVLIENSKTEHQKEELQKRKDLIINPTHLPTFYDRIRKSCYDNGMDEEKQDFRKLTLEKVVANAICRKKLKKFYLVCENPYFEDVKIIKRNQKDEKQKELSLELKHEDTLLKIMAAYLIENYYIDHHTGKPIRFAPFNATALSNWCQCKGFLQGGDYNYRYSNRPLIEKFEQANGVKMRFDREWYDKCEWTLIDATDNDDALNEYLEAHPGRHFYRDDGANKPLAENKRYDR